MGLGSQTQHGAGTVVLEGALTPFGLGNVLQFICSFEGDSLIHVEHDGALVGRVLIRAGRVALVHAGEERGEVAFYRLTQIEGARFLVLRDAEFEPQSSESSRSCTDLLLSAAVFEDEQRRAAGLLPASPTPAVAPPNAPELVALTTVDLERMRAAALTAYLHGDAQRAQALVERCLNAAPGDRRLRLLLDRIKQGAARG